MFEEEEKLPELFSMGNLSMAVIVHALMLFIFWMSARMAFTPEETVIPIDLTVVVQENLDGNENEPPPLTPPEPPPEPPKPQPKPEPPNPKPEPVKVPDAVVQETKKTNIVKKVETKPEPPKLTEKEKREQRMKEMLESAVVVNTPKPAAKPNPKPQPQTNGKTGFKTQSAEEIARLLNQGYKPGVVDSIATSDDQRCASMIKRAFYDKWSPPAYSPSLRNMLLKVQFNSQSQVTGYKLVQSSGDVAADNSVLAAAAAVKYVPGLTTGFLSRNKTITIDFTVTGR